MTTVRTLKLVAFCVSMVCSRDDIKAQVPQQLNPKAAQQYAADSEKAARGDPEAAYRMGEAHESGRLGGVKDLNRALMFYRLAAKNGHRQAAARVPLIEAELSQNQKKAETPSSLGH
ncbi:MAG TPA: SEL1-like repeat protein [Nitrospira sp.]